MRLYQLSLKNQTFASSLPSPNRQRYVHEHHCFVLDCAFLFTDWVQERMVRIYFWSEWQN